MNLKLRLKNPRTLLRLGAAGLLLASLSRWFLHPTAADVRELVDLATGTLYGVAIAGMLLSLRARSRASGCAVAPRAPS